MCDFITKGKKVGCIGGQGGVKNLYFALFSDYTFVVAAQVMSSIGTLDEVFKYEVAGNTNGLNETPTIDWNTGAKYFTQVVAATFPLLSSDLQNELDLLMRNRVIVFVEDYNGNIKVGGAFNAMKVSGGSATTGNASADLSGYTIELTAEEQDMAPFLGSSAKTALLAAVANVYVNEPAV